MTVLMPANEAERLEALLRYDILDTPPEPDFDAIARLAARICQTPIAFITFIGADRQWFKAEVGLGLRETPLDVSICAQVMTGERVVVVPDTAQDPRFAGNPLAQGESALRFYAGARLDTPDGHALGMLCVLDRQPRDLSEEQREALDVLARQVMSLLELRRLLRQRDESLGAHRHARRELRLRSSLLEGQNRILGLIADGADLDTILDRLACTVEEIVPSVRCSILLLDREGGHLRYGAAPSLPAAYVEATDRLPVEPKAGSCGAAAHRRERVVVRDIATDPLWDDFRDLALPLGLRACWSEPILLPDSSLAGTFALYYPEPREPDEVEQDLLAGMARLVRIALERQRKDEALEDEARILDILNQVGRLLPAELDLEKLTQKITDAATEVSGAEFGALFYNRIDERGEAYTLYTLSGAPREAFAGYPMPRNTAVFDPTFRGQGVIRSDDITQDPRYGKNPPYDGMPKGHLPVRSYLAVPVTSRSGEVLGGLFFGHSKPGVFGERAERLVTGIAAQAAIAIDNARLFQHAQREIDERARAEAALREGERRYRFLADSIPQFVWTAQSDGSIDYINARWQEYCRLPLDQGLGWQWESALHPDDRERTVESWLHAVRSGTMFTGEFRLRRHDGAYRWFLSRSIPFRNDEGAVERWFGTATDIEDAKQAEQRIRESERRYRTLIEVLPQLVWTATPDGDADYLSRQWCAYTGRPMEEQLGFRWLDALHPEDRESAKAAWRDAVEGRGDYDVEYRIRRADGEYRWFKVRGVPLRDENGTVRHWFGSCTDITEIVEAREALTEVGRRLEARVQERTRQLEEANIRLRREVEERSRAEEALRQAQKMEAIGKLTGGVAHDFNNLLQVIAGNLQLLSRDIVGNAVAAQRVQNALASVDRGAKLAAQLLAFARKQPLEPQVVNLGRLVHNMGDLLRRSLGETIEIETIVAGGLWNTLVDPMQVENAILNLAVNARDAMEGHGKLTIEVGNAFLDDGYVAAHGSDLKAGQYVMLAVSDTGQGMTPDVLTRAFEPFFTTKGEGQGTGLGLPMVYGFVKQSGGHIKLYSEPGHGTTVKIYLPRERRPETVVVEQRPTGAVSGGTETVLVVEDDAEVRATVVDLLCELGYRVLQAEDGQSALAIVKSGLPIDLLFTDVVMPGPVRSPDLAREARRVLPRLAVLFTSGYTENAIVHGGRLDEGVHLLSKPYRKEDLARKLRQLLDARPVEAARSGAGPAPAPAPEPRALTILLVEDELLIRDWTAEVLRDLGHTVEEAGTAGEALERLARGGVDVLVTDIGLPDRSGEELAADAVRLAPGLRVILATGRASTSLSSAGLGCAGLVLLPKPYQQSDIEKAIAAVTGRMG